MTFLFLTIACFVNIVLLLAVMQKLRDLQFLIKELTQRMDDMLHVLNTQIFKELRKSKKAKKTKEV